MKTGRPEIRTYWIKGNLNAPRCCDNHEMETGIIVLEVYGDDGKIENHGETVAGLYCPGCHDFIQSADYAAWVRRVVDPQALRAIFPYLRGG